MLYTTTTFFNSHWSCLHGWQKYPRIKSKHILTKLPIVYFIHTILLFPNRNSVPSWAWIFLMDILGHHLRSEVSLNSSWFWNSYLFWSFNYLYGRFSKGEATWLSGHVRSIFGHCNLFQVSLSKMLCCRSKSHLFSVLFLYIVEYRTSYLNVPRQPISGRTLYQLWRVT